MKLMLPILTYTKNLAFQTIVGFKYQEIGLQFFLPMQSWVMKATLGKHMFLKTSELFSLKISRNQIIVSTHCFCI